MSRLRLLARAVERTRQRPLVIAYRNDPFGRPPPDLPPGAEVIVVEYVTDWRSAIDGKP
jgi:hypothetical protein